MDHDYNGIIIEDSIAEVPSVNPVISDNISVVTEKENETPKVNIPSKEIYQNHSKSTAGIAIKKKASNSKNIGPNYNKSKKDYLHEAKWVKILAEEARKGTRN
ncbi:hypothetical protein JTB14_004175 [Gonioctena quinquepunctata]|nr:hypothetical protein JTB14_004175 [Gonioctena quinquepunctata]